MPKSSPKKNAEDTKTSSKTEADELERIITHLDTAYDCLLYTSDAADE